MTRQGARRGTSDTVKLFLDANTLVSALLFAGNERRLLDLGRLGVCELVTIQYVREEVRRVLAEPRMRLSETEQNGALAILARHVIVADDPPRSEVLSAKGRVTDKTDLPVVVGFERSGCDFLVTGDKGLLREVPRTMTTSAAIHRLLR